MIKIIETDFIAFLCPLTNTLCWLFVHFVGAVEIFIFPPELMLAFIAAEMKSIPFHFRWCLIEQLWFIPLSVLTFFIIATYRNHILHSIKIRFYNILSTAHRNNQHHRMGMDHHILEPQALCKSSFIHHEIYMCLCSIIK